MPGTSECFRPFPGARHRHRLCCTRSNDHNTRVDCAECPSPANPIALVLTLATATVQCATTPASPSLRSYRPVCFLDARLAVSSGWKTSRTYLTCPASAPTTDTIRSHCRGPHLVPDANEASLTLGELLPAPRLEAYIERQHGFRHGRAVRVLHVNLNGGEPSILNALSVAQACRVAA